MKSFYPNVQYNKGKKRKFLILYAVTMILLTGLFSIYFVQDPKGIFTWIVALGALMFTMLLPGVMRAYPTKGLPIIEIDDKVITYGGKFKVELKDIVKAKINVMVVTSSKYKAEIEEELKYVAANLEDDEYFGDVDLIIKGEKKEEQLYATVMDCVGALQALIDFGVKEYEINVFSGKYNVKSNYKLYKTQSTDNDGIEKLSKKDRIKQLL